MQGVCPLQLLLRDIAGIPLGLSFAEINELEVSEMDKNRDSRLNIFTAPTADWFAGAFGGPTEVQKEAWPAIAKGGPVLISAPTGTGKTLSAFLVFIDRLMELASQGELREELYLVYVSPLKSLAGDIRENLNRPLSGIAATRGGESACAVTVAMRTGDTPQKDRQRMIKHPPHILITTPESLYLMLTSRGGQSILRTARALIIDELHALIDTKRGAHLMLCAARLDVLCGRPLQRIGLSATIEPLEVAAEYLSPDYTQIVAPSMHKDVRIEVNGITPSAGRRRDPVWEDLARKVYDRCLECRSVIAFSESRRYAEKLAYYVNQLGGEDFARVHHGSMSKEQRAEVEADLRSGNLRLLCATSSMELGIDVGDIDQVLQVGCPRSISSTMQRLGRAGHNPGRVSVMYMYPRTAPETLYCGMTAQVAREGGVEHAKPPRLCFDVLAQHLVSMAAAVTPVKKKKSAVIVAPADTGNIVAYTLDEVMDILSRAYPFREVQKEDVRGILKMLAGDYEHSREIPVRPRVLYDRLHECVYADSYSRMLAVAAGGTIPDKGLYTAKTEDGVKVGELDEEFVYESYLGDRFLLGSFAWKIVGKDKDSVIVTQTHSEGARLPFWKGETKGRDLSTSLKFGGIMRELSNAAAADKLRQGLEQLGLDEAACENTEDFLKRQLAADDILPDDRTIVIEHFTDSNGNHQAMLHTIFGRRVNTPLSLLLQHAAQRILDSNVGCVDEEDGILLYSYGEESIPEHLLYSIEIDSVRETLEAMLPATPVFSMSFRYNAARALMMGMHHNGRQPLWMQRLRSTEMLESLVKEKEHPLIRETKRECLEDQWDIKGLISILNDVRSGRIAVREMYLELPSPMSLPMQWSVEAAEMYQYTPTTPGIHQAVYEEIKQLDQVRPSAQALKQVQERKKLPDTAEELHSLLMMEGDITVTELKELYAALREEENKVPGWLESLAERGLAAYIEPGLWIAAEHRAEYTQALCEEDAEAGTHLIRRMLYYRGPQSAGQISERYLPGCECVEQWLATLCVSGEIVKDGELYYHAKLYDRARKATIQSMRREAVTRPPESYAALIAGRALINAATREQLKQTLELYCGQMMPVSSWENIIFPRRVRRYNEGLLDRLLAEGEYFWKMPEIGQLCFCRYEDIDWDKLPELAGNVTDGNDNANNQPGDMANKEHDKLSDDERIIYQELLKRGASFLKALSGVPVKGEPRGILTSLAEKGLVCADSFVPVRQWQNREKIQRSSPRQRVNVRVAALSAGRWDIVHPTNPGGLEELLENLLKENTILCREIYKSSISQREDTCSGKAPDWGRALEILRVWEYTGQVRRGYFVKGLSGAQFIRKEDYESTIHALEYPDEEIIWLNSADPAQLWGKLLEHQPGRAFLNVPGTAVALKAGVPIMVLERQGKVLRLLENMEPSEALQKFVDAFREKTIFPEKKRLIVKEYPAHIGEALGKAGFIRELMDYVLYR